jgi:hypothetical protein
MSFNYIINRQVHDLYNLQLQIYKSGLTTISYITGTTTSIDVFFSSSLTTQQQTDLNTLVTNYIDSIEEYNSSEFISRINSTNIPLIANATYSGVYEKISSYSSLTLTCLTDVNCTLTVYYSNDGITDHVVQNYTIKKNLPFIEMKTITFLYYKIGIVNDFLAQTQITMQSSAHLYKNKNIVDTTQVNEISIKTEAVKTGGNFKTTSFSLNIPGNTTSTISFTKPYRISVLEFTFRTLESHSSDILNAYIGKNSVIGVIASNAYINNTSLVVSSTVIQYLYVGYSLKITDGVNMNDLGEVLSIVENTITFSGNITNNFLIGTYVQMSVKPVDNFVIGPAGFYSVGSSYNGASGIAANTPISLEYTNTSNDIKTFTLNLDYLY